MSGNNSISFRINVQQVMQCIQALYQNGEIDNNEKNRLSLLIKNAIKDNDTSELYEHFRALSYGTTMTDVLQDCLNLTRT